LTSSKSKIFSWTLFDFANTSFSVIIVTVIFSKYFSNYVASGQKWIWGLAVSVSMIFAALLSPPLGAIADVSRNRKRFLLMFTLLSVICTFLMFFVQRGDIILGFVLFVLANIGFESGLVFYDAFLPNLTEKKNFGRVSGYGFAMGYVGALTVLLIVMFMLPENSSPDYYYFVRLTFVVAAAFFITFSIPLFLFISEPKTSDVVKKDLIVKGINKSFERISSLRKNIPLCQDSFSLSFFITML
jgi:UMF1 family MFS transporter